MRIQTKCPRSILALLLATVLLGVVPGAAAQALTPLVGDPVPYRVSLPAQAKISGPGDFLIAESGNLAVLIITVDMMEQEGGNRLPISDSEARRAMTNMFMGSDALLLGVLDAAVRNQSAEVTDVVREIRTLGGQRSGYLRGRTECSCGHPAIIEMHVTVKDGIAYTLMFAAHGEDLEQSEELIARIHESFVLADAPPAASPRERRRGIIRRRTNSSS
jgi:hypothetical protein